MKNLLSLTFVLATLNAYELNPKVDLNIAPAYIKSKIEVNLNYINIQNINKKIYSENLAAPFALNITQFKQEIEKLSNHSQLKTIKIKEFYIAKN